MSALYIHIPFCASKCIYCDFYSIAKNKQAVATLGATYVDALLCELRDRQHFLPAAEPIRTVYLGGGTPSLLPVSEIRRLLHDAAEIIDLSQVEEVTLEANPEDVTAEFSEGLSETCINRVSMGVQSFVDAELRIIRRRHDARRAEEAVMALRRNGIRNISLDLIYGLPTQSEASWLESIRRCIALGVEHISAYCLSVEEGTLLSRRVSEGALTLPDDDTCVRFNALLREYLHAAGYEQYELSNYARPGYYSRHNSCYWDGTPYLGLGPGAHSYDGALRRGNNAPDVRAYIANGANYREEVLTEQDRYNELIMLGLRTRRGVSFAQLSPYFAAHPDLQKYFERQYGTLLAEKLIQEIPNRSFSLSESGLNLADDVIRRLFYLE